MVAGAGVNAADSLRARLAELGTPERAAGEKAYLKSGLQHLGVRVPDVRREVKAALRSGFTHDDFWIRRSGVLALGALLAHGRELDRFFGYAERLLREISSAHPREVSTWLRAHMADMNLVTLREPMRRLPDADELRALYDARRNSSG